MRAAVKREGEKSIVQNKANAEAEENTRIRESSVTWV